MSKDNMSTFFISSNLYAFLLILLSQASSGAHYQYESCIPKNCGGGPSISFPFYIQGLQESYCGYPGFVLTCEDSFPILKLPESNFVVEDIFYQNRSLRLYHAAVLRSEDSCIPRIRNTTLPASHCKNDWALALFDKDDNLKNAMEKCDRNIVAPVEGYGNNGTVNNLEEVLRRGFVLNWSTSDCSTCENSGGRCGFNETTYHFKCFCPDRPRSRTCVPDLFMWRKYELLKILSLQKAKPEREKDIELFLQNQGNLAPRRYKYSDIKKMTNSVSEKLGKGGYGSVYKGKLSDGRVVAVKILNESKENGEDFINEVASISRTSHINIVTLLGFCYEGSKRALVYDFMPNGSLDKFIQNTANWKKLFEIAVGIARGLEYLHRGCNTRILHFDIKPHNILLAKDFNPKISDFGLAKLCPNRSSIVSMLAARGTIGYIAPEVFCRNFGEVSHKSDVYSYGMMTLEIAGGRKNIDPEEVDRSSEIYFPQYLYKQLETDDKNGVLEGIMNEDERQYLKRKMIIVGLWCIQTDPKDRPSMSRVVEMLEGKLESLQVPPKPYLSSPQRSRSKFSTSDST
ncbi:Serine/threonine protein kinase [Handroanthus impetiginosus]|uniref:non-specific serine/threonine protein kinase n=1 Tax=Handroanthus impetiginosus TaxID=429701 RepID=A0A2G9HBR2_9LAMI|nr:Serine/threonine protein kinase [Handroanthus impetiginosus]